jgi:hypothetical protein
VIAAEHSFSGQNVDFGLWAGNFQEADPKNQISRKITKNAQLSVDIPSNSS